MASFEPTTSSDPRIARTRKHVIEIAREMLAEHKEPLSFTTVADRAFVARQTLYKHWGTVENLIAETIVLPHIDENGNENAGLSVKDRAEKFLLSISEHFSKEGTAALGAVFSAGHYSEDSDAAARKIDTELYDSFQSSVGSVDHDGFAQIVGPVLYLALAGIEPGRELIVSLSDRAIALVV